MELLTILIVWIFGSALAGKLATSKGLNGGTYFLISLLLSPIVGLIAAGVTPRNERAVEAARVASGTDRKCPYCAEVVKREATICRFCHKELPPLEPLPAPVAAPPDAGADAAMAARFKTRADYEAWKATFRSG